jgi:O-methyltransferase
MGTGATNTLPSLLGPEKLAVLEALAAIAPSGALIEVGVYQGGSAEVLYRVAISQERELWLYDTFCGTPHQDAADQHKLGDFADAIKPEVLRGKLARAHVVEGIFSLESELPRRIAFAHLDVDQYRSTREALAALIPNLVAGAMVLVDDWSHEGCQAACREFDVPITVLPDGRALLRPF